ncbi:squalestatin S1 biosynthesis cluster protein L1 [Physcia stellaris]|nr:squalestatin S1 biosynthesis cluster protein L1 [Physcia stellaris]
MALSHTALRIPTKAMKQHPRLLTTAISTTTMPPTAIPRTIPPRAIHTAPRPHSSLFSLGGSSTSQVSQYPATLRLPTTAIPRTTIRRAIHTSPCPRSSLFNLGGLATSRESQYLAKERGIPRTEFSPHLELIRASEVDTQRVEGEDGRGKEEEGKGKEQEGRGKEEEERMRHEIGWVTISAEEYTALRGAKEAKEVEEGVREAQEEMREAEGELDKAEMEWKEAHHKLWEARQDLREADKERRKTKIFGSASHDSIQPKNGYVTLSKTQYTALMETVEAEKKLREIDKNQSKARNEIRKADQKLIKAREEVRAKLTKRTFGSEDHGSVQHKDGYVTMTKAEYTALKEAAESEEDIKEKEEDKDGYVAMREAEYSLLKRRIKLIDGVLKYETLDPPDETQLKKWVILGLLSIFLGLIVLSYGEDKLKRKVEIGSTTPESTEDADAISNNAEPSKEPSQTWAMSKLLWAAND